MKTLTIRLASILSVNLLVVSLLFSQQCIIADFPFNGNANDATGNGNNGAITGALPTTDRYGSANSAYFFDAVDDVIATNNTLGNFGLGNYSISCWIKTSETGTARFISKRPTCSFGSFYDISVASGKIGFEAQFNNSLVAKIGTKVINDGNWHHIAFVRSVTLYSIYVDGILDASVTSSAVYNSDNNALLQFGKDVCTGVGQSVKYTGAMDDIKIFNCALNASEVALLAGGALSISLSTTSANCGSSDGTATVIVSNGSGNYSYQWSTNGSSSVITGLSAGHYSVTVTDVSTGMTGVSSTDVVESCGHLCVIADFPFTGDANDMTGNGNDGTITGATLMNDRYGNSNSAYGFDAIDDVVVTNSTLGNFGQSDYSISCWLQTSLQTGTGRFISKRSACSFGSFYDISIKAGKIGFEVQDNSTLVANLGSAIVNDGNWHHVTFVRFGTLYSIYVDGVLDVSATSPSLFNSNNNAPLQFGKDVCTGVGQGVKFTGALDDIKVFNCALNAGEVGVLFRGLSVNASSTRATCGMSDGTATVSVSGGSGSYSYLWLPPVSTDSVAVGLFTGTYSVTITDDSSGAIVTANIDVSYTYETSSTISSTPVCLGEPTQFTLTNSDSLVSWEYTFSNGVVSTQQNPSQTFIYCPPFDNWASVIVTNTFGCRDTLIEHAVVNCPVHAGYYGQASTKCYNDCEGTASINITQGTAPFSIQWSDPLQQTTATATNLCAGAYTVSVSDANGCSTTLPAIDVYSPNQFAGTISTYDISCFGQASGTAVLFMSGGTLPISYLWDNPAHSIDNMVNGLTADTYCVTATDGHDCSFGTCITITQPSEISIITTVNNAACGVCNGSITVTATGGAAPYTYLWSNGTSGASASGLCAGAYYVDITDNNGCTKRFAVPLSNVNGPQVALTKTDILCSGSCSGSATAAPSSCPSCIIKWVNENGDSIGNSSVVSNLCNGDYTLIVKNPVNGCSSATAFQISQPTAIVAVTSVVDVLIIGNCSGSVSVTASGGIPPYTYQWADSLYTPLAGATSSMLANLCAGEYNVRVTDANGCQTPWALATVNEPPGLTITAASVTAALGSQAVVPITVESFQNIAGAQGSIEFDPLVISFVQAEQFGLPGMNASNFGTLQVSSGVLTFIWDDLTTLGVSLTDGSIIFALRFNVAGSAGQQSNIDFVNAPTILEFIDPQANPVNASFISGVVTVSQPIAVSGSIRSKDGQPIPAATVSLTGQSTQSTTTAANGSYTLNISLGGSYTITPSKSNDINTNNGITTADILLTRRHIIGSQLLPTPYKIIAADVNGSDNVSTQDVLLMRSVILNNTSFPNGRLWAFVPSSHVFSNPMNPFPFPASLTYANITPLSGQNFIGMKLGDVNDSWDHNILKMGTVGEVKFTMDEYQALPGEEVSVPVKVKDFDNVAGYQFTLSWDSEVLTFMEVNNKKLDGYFGINYVAEGFLTTSWNDDMAKAVTLGDDEAVFELKFKVTGAVGTYSEINIGSELTANEAYNDNIDMLNVLPVSGMVKVGNMSSFNTTQSSINLTVQPNPFRFATKIIFSIPEDANVSIEMYDFLGKQIRKVDAPYKSGEHTIEWNGNDEAGNHLSSGLYHVRMVAGEYNKAVKVILSD